jgi:hypothetical protein
LATGVMRRVDPLTRTGTVIVVVGLVAAALVLVHLALVEGGWGVHLGPLHVLRRVGFAAGYPFHRLVTIKDESSQVLVNDSIAAASYVAVGVVLKRLLG